MTFDEILHYFKENESIEIVSLMIDDAILRQGLAAWEYVEIKENSRIGKCKETATDTEKWEWLWSKVKINYESWSSSISVDNKNSIPSIFKRLRQLRLIYPDGSINGMAKQYLSVLINQQLKKALNKK